MIVKFCLVLIVINVNNAVNPTPSGCLSDIVLIIDSSMNKVKNGNLSIQADFAHKLINEISIDNLKDRVGLIFMPHKYKSNLKKFPLDYFKSNVQWDLFFTVSDENHLSEDFGTNGDLALALKEAINILDDPKVNRKSNKTDRALVVLISDGHVMHNLNQRLQKLLGHVTIDSKTMIETVSIAMSDSKINEKNLLSFAGNNPQKLIKDPIKNGALSEHVKSLFAQERHGNCDPQPHLSSDCDMDIGLILDFSSNLTVVNQYKAFAKTLLERLDHDPQSDHVSFSVYHAGSIRVCVNMEKHTTKDEMENIITNEVPQAGNATNTFGLQEVYADMHRHDQITNREPVKKYIVIYSNDGVNQIRNTKSITDYARSLSAKAVEILVLGDLQQNTPGDVFEDMHFFSKDGDPQDVIDKIKSLGHYDRCENKVKQ